jgi:hypothetical protein
VCTLSVDLKQPFSLFYLQTVDILNNPTQEHWDSCVARGTVCVSAYRHSVSRDCSIFAENPKPRHAFISLPSTLPFPLTIAPSAVTYLITSWVVRC